MPASENPRQTHISAVDETEGAPVDAEGSTPAEHETTAEEPSERTAPGEE